MSKQTPPLLASATPRTGSALSIAGLRKEMGLSQEEFAARIGLASKGNMSLMERGLRTPTVAQALMIEQLSGGRIDAAKLNVDVRLCRMPGVAAGTGFGPVPAADAVAA